MARLHDELRRLYAAQPSATPPDEALELIDAQGQVRALVLELARPADWDLLSRVWKGVQQDLALPAPAIAVNGRDGYQLWFSLQAAVPASQANDFLNALRKRYLGDLPTHRWAGMPSFATSPVPAVRHATAVPALQPDTRQWSAFVAADLTPMFVDEPWLDLPPSPEGQASLLARLESVRADDFAAALQRLVPAEIPLPVVAPSGQAAAAPTHQAHHAQDHTGQPPLQPRQFLLNVMNDPGVPMALRIEAAKALLPLMPCEPRP
jgi:hypothetical protein